MDNERSGAKPLSVPSGRLARLGHLGGMTAGIAGNMAISGAAQLTRGARPTMRDLLLTPRNVTRVTEQLAKMRGAAMKIGQLVSMDSGDLLPPELAQIMARLRDDAHHMPPAQLKTVLNAQWPKGWLGHFEKFDVRPIAAASIGQVHRARLKDGRDLAIKVQYPGVAASIDSDVTNVGALIRVSGLLPKGIDIGPYLVQARSQLHQETDYLREAEQAEAFRALLREDPRFQVPAPHTDWTTPCILAMDYISGAPIEDAAREDQATRNRIARTMIELTLKELFEFGLMQTDPNFANYLYDAPSQRIALLDFGAAQRVSDTTATGYRRLIAAGVAGDARALEDAAEGIGFLAPDTPAAQRSAIVDMMQLAFTALAGHGTIDFSDTTLPREMQERGMALAASGYAPPPLPMDVLLVQRKLGGVFLLAARLGATLDVTPLLAPYI